MPSPDDTHAEAFQDDRLLSTYHHITEQKAAQDTLVESEHQFRTLIQGVTDYAIYRLDTEGRVVSWNAGAERAKGYSAGEIVGRHFSCFYAAEDQVAGEPARALKAARDDGRYTAQGWRLRKDGSRFWADVVIDPIIDAGQLIGFTKITRDITERKAAQDALEESESNFRMLADCATDLVVKFSIDGEVQYVSPSCKAYGYEPAELIGAASADLIHPDDRARAFANLAPLLQGLPADPTADRINRFKCKDGTYVWLEGNPRAIFDDAGRPTGLFNVLRDVTRRKAAEAALAESELRHSVIAEHATDVILRSGVDGEVLYASPSILDVTGFDAAEFERGSTRLRDRVHSDDLKAGLAHFYNIVRGTVGKTARHTYRFQRKDGAWIWIESNPTLIRNAAGEPVEVLDLIRDVTAQRKTEAYLTAAREAAEAAASVKSEFLANMSHEIRTPLTAILGFTRLLAEGDNLDETARAQVARVAGAGEALLAIVNDVLDFSKLEAGQFEIAARPVPAAEVLRETLTMFSPQAEDKGLTLVFEAAPNLPTWIKTDPNRLRQIPINLIGNAVKFTDSGEVRLVATYQARSQKLAVRVVDTGPGMNRAQQQKLFQRFSQVDASTTRRHGGTGLGLAICKGLTEVMGGDIGVRSKLGAGSVFHFRIAAPRTEAPVSVDVTNDTAPVDGLRVLVADDNATNRELAQAILASMGVEVTLVIDGLEAVQAAKTAPFDVILMDIRMPNMDGSAAAERVRREAGPNQNVPILAFSADADMSRFEESASNFNGIVRKPLVPADLIAALIRSIRWEEESPGQTEATDAATL